MLSGGARFDSTMTDTTVLVTGATGFVGRRLVPTLVERGFAVRAMTRHPDDYAGEGETVGGDVHDADSLVEPLLGVDVAVYLVHSLDSVDFERRDANAARAFGRVAAEAGVRQIIYLGGLGAMTTSSPRTCARDARSRAFSARPGCR